MCLKVMNRRAPEEVGGLFPEKMGDVGSGPFVGSLSANLR